MKPAWRLPPLPRFPWDIPGPFPILEKYRRKGWISFEVIPATDREAMQDLILSVEPRILVTTWGLAMRIATRAFTEHASQFIKGRDGAPYSHFIVGRGEG